MLMDENIVRMMSLEHTTVGGDTKEAERRGYGVATLDRHAAEAEQAYALEVSDVVSQRRICSGRDKM